MKRRSTLLRALAFFGLVLAVSPAPTAASAHEFWIEPHDFTIEPDAPIKADILIGSDFKGDAFPYIPSRFVAFTHYDRLGDTAVDGAAGDLPALSLTPRAEGLNIFTYVSVDDRIRFREWEKFATYLELEGLDTIPARHDARGLPRDDVRELYTRCAKTLVAVGDDASETDRATGMRLELIAGENPLTLTPGATIDFTLLWEGQPLAGAQVALFRRGADGALASRTLARTDADGKTSFPLPAPGTYMAASVHMIEAAADRNADWHSFWASLTFGVE